VEFYIKTAETFGGSGSSPPDFQWKIITIPQIPFNLFAAPNDEKEMQCAEHHHQY
jgi:hypothetical protein